MPKPPQGDGRSQFITNYAETKNYQLERISEPVKEFPAEVKSMKGERVEWGEEGWEIEIMWGEERKEGEKREIGDVGKADGEQRRVSKERTIYLSLSCLPSFITQRIQQRNVISIEQKSNENKEKTR